MGKKAGSDKFLVAGKTGTAQMSKGALGYKTGGTNYLLSFAGFFPADNHVTVVLSAYRRQVSQHPEVA